MKHLLLTTIAAVVLVGCGPSMSIHEAAERGDIEVVKQHLDFGTDVNAKDRINKSTALVDAVRFGHKEVVELLLSKGGDVETKDINSDTPLIWASGADGKYANEIVELLIANGANVKYKTKEDQMTPLHFAAAISIEQAKLLIANGADVNAKTKGTFEDSTPLHEAVKSIFMNTNQKAEMVEYLIANGADVNSIQVINLWSGSVYGTALDIAHDQKRTEVFEDVLPERREDRPLKEPTIFDLIRKHGGKTGAELKAEGK